MELPVSRESLHIGAGMAGLTLVLTLLAGLFGGVGIGLVLLRCLLFAVLLGLLGVGIGVVLERFVPGIWEHDAGADAGGAEPVNAYQEPSSGGGVDFTVSDGDGTAGGAGFHSELPDGETGFGGSGPPAKGSSRHGDVVGNYRIIDDKRFPEDPDSYAKAIRTMMHKDD